MGQFGHIAEQRVSGSSVARSPCQGASEESVSFCVIWPGSAAAVAAGMVPLSIGTQTGGSVIRPAAFCGIVGMKPSFGLIPRTGILPQSPFLDTVGVFARSVEDCALLVEVQSGHDPADPATQAIPMPRMLSVAQSKIKLLFRFDRDE